MAARGGLTVLVGLDGSSTSWDAFWWACGQAGRLAGRLVVMFVTPAVPPELASCALGAPMPDYSEVERTRGDEVAKLRSEVESSFEGGCELSFVHASGDAASELLRAAARLEADLLVIGRSTKLQHHLVGSIGRRLISKRDAPVVVVVP